MDQRKKDPGAAVAFCWCVDGYAQYFNCGTSYSRYRKDHAANLIFFCCEVAFREKPIGIARKSTGLDLLIGRKLTLRHQTKE